MNFQQELENYEIGGIGDINRNTLRFHSYRTGTEDGKLTLYAVYEAENPPKVFSGYPSGQDLLVELCNLHLKLKGKTQEECLPIIQSWCLTNIHPYYMFDDTRIAKFEEDKDDYWDLMVNILEAYYIRIVDMCADLEKLYIDTMTVFAIRSLLEGNEYEAQKFYSNIQHQPEDNILRQWRITAPDQRLRLIDNYTRDLPKFSMGLQRDDVSNRLVFQPEVSSVIQAAYYGLSRFVAVNSGALKDWGGKTSIAFCQACGRAFIKTGNRQKYCSEPECQSIRNQRKSRDYYYRERKKAIDKEIEEILS